MNDTDYRVQLLDLGTPVVSSRRAVATTQHYVDWIRYKETLHLMSRSSLRDKLPGEPGLEIESTNLAMWLRKLLPDTFHTETHIYGGIQVTHTVRSAGQGVLLSCMCACHSSA